MKILHYYTDIKSFLQDVRYFKNHGSFLITRELP